MSVIVSACCLEVCSRASDVPSCVNKMRSFASVVRDAVEIDVESGLFSGEERDEEEGREENGAETEKGGEGKEKGKEKIQRDVMIGVIDGAYECWGSKSKMRMSTYLKALASSRAVTIASVAEWAVSDGRRMCNGEIDVFECLTDVIEARIRWSQDDEDDDDDDEGDEARRGGGGDDDDDSVSRAASRRSIVAEDVNDAMSVIINKSLSSTSKKGSRYDTALNCGLYEVARSCALWSVWDGKGAEEGTDLREYVGHFLCD